MGPWQFWLVLAGALFTLAGVLWDKMTSTAQALVIAGIGCVLIGIASKVSGPIKKWNSRRRGRRERRIGSRNLSSEIHFTADAYGEPVLAERLRGNKRFVQKERRKAFAPVLNEYRREHLQKATNLFWRLRDYDHFSMDENLIHHPTEIEDLREIANRFRAAVDGPLHWCWLRRRRWRRR